MTRRAPGTLLLVLLGCTAAARALAGISASLDRSQIASGDTVQLTLEHDGSTRGQPDVAPLQHDFDILGTSSSTTYELVNGSASEKTDIVLTLAPKVTGRLTIPALSWGGQQSQPLSLTVTGPDGNGQPGTAGAPAAARIFIQATVSPQQPYVEAAVHLTVRLFTSETLYHADLELPDDSNFVVKQIGSDQTSDAERHGRTYQVVTRQYLLFPLHSGKLTLQGPVLDAEVAVGEARTPFGNSPFGGFFGGRLFSGVLHTVQPVRVHGNPVELTVRPRPAGAVGSYWLPADDVSLSAAWNPTQLQAPAGDPVTLDLDLRATGLTAAQLPDLASLLRVPAGLQAYPDQAKLNDSMQNGQLVGDREQTIALMADKPGRYTIPALEVSWWDTRTRQPRTVTLPPRTLTILPAPGAAAPAASSPPLRAAQPGPAPAASGRARSAAAAPSARHAARANSASDWKWLSIGLGLVWLATLGAWLASRRLRAVPRSPGRGPRRPAPPPDSRRTSDPSRERAAFRAACAANDAQAARAHLLAWAAALWGATPPGVTAIAARLGDANVLELLRDLDRACYAGGAWLGQPLAAALTGLPPAPGKSARGRDGLAPLYP